MVITPTITDVVKINNPMKIIATLLESIPILILFSTELAFENDPNKIIKTIVSFLNFFFMLMVLYNLNLNYGVKL